jgi:hypothetical protein
MNRVFLVICFCAFIFSACDRTNQKYDKAYFDFDSLINMQVAELVKIQSTIRKKSIINEKEDNSSFVPDSLKLANELDVFRQVDIINKPLYRNAYEIKDGEKDTKSNLLIRSYTAKVPSPVPFVRFYYQSSSRDIKKIESVFHEENTLYDTRRNLLLEFDDSSGSLLLKGYQLSGTQKMILNDTVNFSVSVSFSSGKH